MKKSILSLLLLIIFSCSAIAQRQSIQELIDSTPNGGTVKIAKGKYIIDEPLLIQDRHGLTLQGEKGTKILCTDVWKNVLEVKNSRSIRLEGMYFSHEKPLEEYQCNGGVIDLENSNKIQIDNCEMEGSGTVGVYGRNVNNITVSQCYIHDNTFNAFYFQDGNDILIHSCIVENNANFIQAYGLQGLEMSDNIIRNNGGYWRDLNDNAGLRD